MQRIISTSNTCPHVHKVKGQGFCLRPEVPYLRKKSAETRTNFATSNSTETLPVRVPTLN